MKTNTLAGLVSEEFFRALADQTRLRCLLLLAQEGELCVCELTHALDLAQPKISRHLAMLRKTGVVAVRQAGLWMFYRLHPGLPAWAAQVIAATAQGLLGQPPFAGDWERLQRMSGRPAGRECCVVPEKRGTNDEQPV